jgi:hypothetical protein
MKYVNIRKPEAGPLGETFLDARVRAIADAFFVNSPSGGRVESVWTFAIHRSGLLLGIRRSYLSRRCS